jgi:hypothetical protein
VRLDLSRWGYHHACLCALAMAACTGTIGDAAFSSGARGATSTAGTADASADALVCTGVDAGAAPLERLTRVQYGNAVRDLLGLKTPFDVTLLAEDEKVGPFSSNDVAPVSELTIEQYTEAAETLALAAEIGLAALAPCDRTTQDDAACASQFIDVFGRRAYRRPLADEEKAAYTALYADYAAGGYDDAIRVVVETMLQSPNFLYHVELAPPASTAGVLPLDPFELASRLSFFLATTTPDDALLDAAAQGTLADEAGLRAQAERLLSAPTATDALASFHLQWLELDALGSLTKAPAVYPAFDATMAAAMQDETTRFVDYVFRKGDAKLETLLTAPYSFLEGPLFALYGVTPVAGADPSAPVMLDPKERAGLLTQGSFLAMHGHENQSAPVQRGKVIIRNVLCESLPDPPPNVDTTPPDPSPGATTRQRFAVHETDPSCAGCHKRIDGVGMGLENYDGIGAYRTMDGTQPVDATGQFLDTKDLDGPFNGAIELSHDLAGSPEVAQCVATQWLRFALGRMETDADGCSLQGLHQAFDASGHDVRALLISVALSDSFRSKRVEGATP